MGQPVESDNMPGSHGVYRVEVREDGRSRLVDDLVAEEVPVAISYNRRSYAVMLATPANLELFVLGFSLSEGIIDRAEELEHLEVLHQPEGIELRARIPAERIDRLPAEPRLLEGRSGCGLCGSRSLERVQGPRRPVARSNWQLGGEALTRAAGELQQRQLLRRATGAVHAAAWAEPDGRVRCVTEDVGRHNALDKLIGTIAAHGWPPQSGFVLVTSRASFEMVQKSAAVGVPLLAAVSAPTGLAIRTAAAADLTLIGFTRPPARYVVYHDAGRLKSQQEPAP